MSADDPAPKEAPPFTSAPDAPPGGAWGRAPLEPPMPAPMVPFPYGGPPVDPMAMASLQRLQKIRQVVVAVALGLLVLSIASPSPLLAYVRAACWAGAGVASLAEAQQARRMGFPTNALRAVIYFLVALLPLLRGR